MGNEYEIVEDARLCDARLFLVDLSHRNLHMHKEFELCLLLAGQLDVYVQKTTFLFSKNDFFLLNPKQPHEIHASSGQHAMVLSLQVSPRFCDRYFPAIRQVEFDRTDINRVLDPGRKERVRRIMLELAGSYFDGGDYYELACYSRINALFCELLSAVPWHSMSEDEKAAKNSVSERLNRIMAHVEKHFAEKILLGGIARQENLSLSYLSHYFKDKLNLTFQDYVALLRFEEARKLLEHTAMSVTDICISCGFSDSRYLNKAFCRHLGCTPAEYRKKGAGQEQWKPVRSVGAVQRILPLEESGMLVKEYLGIHNHEAGWSRLQAQQPAGLVDDEGDNPGSPRLESHGQERFP